MPNRSEYERLLEQAYQRDKGRLEEERKKGIESIQTATPLFGYYPPRWMLDFGATCAFLFNRSGDEQLAEQGKQALFFYQEWRAQLPNGSERMRPEYKEGIPPLEMVFYPVLFAPAVKSLEAALSAGETDALVGMLADSLRPIWRFPEWGGHNRAMLRAAGLAVSAANFPHHPDAARWASMADELAEESWGRWSIEDTMLYQTHWLRALIVYGEARGRAAQLIDLLQPRVYLKALTQLISPLGIPPDFGDSHWLMHSSWEWMACLEWGAAAYADPAMKWAASRLFEERQVEQPSVYLSQALNLAWRWCDDSIEPRPPLNREDALDDLVLKKLVWRTGWHSDDTYACLNYRDEGDYARVARDYLRSTLAVSAEKMHHGHADEGSFVMLVHDGTLLLHESGYREKPPDGIYRSGVYHNRIVSQPGSVPEGNDLLVFLRADGRYQPVRTERLYHTHLADAQISRVRTTDDVQGLVWDRSVVFLPGLPCWVIIDGVLSTRTSARTHAALWWTTDLLDQGENWFDTHIRGVMDWKNTKNAALLVNLPTVAGSPGVVETFPFRRHFQGEVALARTWFGNHRAGTYVNFVSVLWPHPYGESAGERARAIEVVESVPAGRALGVNIRWGGEERTIATLNDLAVGVGNEDVRPNYSASRGTAVYGSLASDAAFVYRRQAAGEDWVGFINGTFLEREGEVLFNAPPLAMFQEDGTARSGISSRFRWELSSVKPS